MEAMNGVNKIYSEFCLGFLMILSSPKDYCYSSTNRSIADWLRAPDTMYLLDFVKPEFLLLRVWYLAIFHFC